MPTYNIVSCADSSGVEITKIYQWDKDRKLFIDSVETSPLPTICFRRPCMDGVDYNDVTYVTPEVDGGILVVSIPNVLLEREEYLKGDVIVTDDGNEEIIGTILIQIVPRIRPADSEYVETN